MKLEEIVGLANKDSAGRNLAENFTQDSSINAVQALVGIEGQLNEPTLAPLLSAAPDMTPARHRTQLENSLSLYKKELTNAVLENTEEASKGFTNQESTALYLLSNPLRPAVYGKVSNDWVKKYASARESYLFLKNPENDMSKKVDELIKEQIDYLKSKKVSSGIISGLLWVYDNHPKLIQDLALAKSHEKVKKFANELDVAEGRSYILDRVNKLEGKDKDAEAYRMGQALAR